LPAYLGETLSTYDGAMESRRCEQCGSAFEPRREHSRFCSASCRVRWNREWNLGEAAEGTALDWSVEAMRDATTRLAVATAASRARAFALVGEAVWWVTIVDGTLMRYHPETCDEVLRSESRPGRHLIEGTLAGLRFVRNQMACDIDHRLFVRHPSPGRGSIVSAWQWAPVDRPAIGSLPPQSQEWESARYEAYQSYLANNAIGETFGRAFAFVDVAAAKSARAANSPRRRHQAM
jgi:hypothetical protein